MIKSASRRDVLELTIGMGGTFTLNSGGAGHHTDIDIGHLNIQSTSTSWPMFQGGPLNTGYSSIQTGTASPSTAWTFQAGDVVGSSPAVANGLVFFGSGDGDVYAVDAETGSEEWRYSTGGNVASAPAVESGTVYIGSADRNIYALDANTGDAEWQTDIGRKNFYPITVRDGRVFAGTEGNASFHALDANSGQRLWEYERPGGGLGDNMASAPAVTDSTVYVGDNDARVTALDITSGVEQWRFDSGKSGSLDGRFKGGVTVGDTQLYVCDTGGTTYGVALSDGSERWRYETGSGQEDRAYVSPAIVPNSSGSDTVITFGVDGAIHALDAQDGSSDWTRSLDGDIRSSPTVASDTILTADSTGRLWGLSSDGGGVRWTVDVGPVQTSSPAITESHIYIGCTDGTVHALQHGSQSGGVTRSNREMTTTVRNGDAAGSEDDSSTGGSVSRESATQVTTPAIEINPNQVIIQLGAFFSLVLLAAFTVYATNNNE